jgi:threonine dehydrogenase-like Zn-dependent dehydrogenase
VQSANCFRLRAASGNRGRFLFNISQTILKHFINNSTLKCGYRNESGKQNSYGNMKGVCKMKALIYNGIGNVELVEKEIPDCGRNDVIVKTVRSGICGSDITAYKYGGENMQIFTGREFGHEMVGYVYRIGEDVRNIKLESRAFVDPNYCTPDPYEANMAGAFSQYVRVHNAEWGRNLYELPESLSYDDAVLIEPFSVATHGKNNAGTKPDENVLIIGAGTIGLCFLSSLVAQGNKKTVVLDIDDRRLGLAEKMGAAGFNTKRGGDTLLKFLEGYFGTMQNKNHRLEYENGNMAVIPNSVVNIDVVIDCAGIAEYVDEFMKHAKQRARYCCIAVHQKSIPIRFHEVMSTQCSIMGSRGYTKNDIEEVIFNLVNKKSNVTEIITHKYPFTEAKQAFETAAQPSQAIKVVLDMAV